jgi:hypothetical protein
LIVTQRVTRKKAAEIVEVGRATVQRYVVAFREGSLDDLRRWDLNRPVSEMAAYCGLIRESFENQPATTAAEACQRIFPLTGQAATSSEKRTVSAHSDDNFSGQSAFWTVERLARTSRAKPGGSIGK